MKNISLREAKEFISYDPETGIFTRIKNSSNVKCGDRADTVDGKLGYRKVKLKGQNFKAHRIAILFITGEMPIGPVDHINGDRSDNRALNLRSCTDAGNAHNAKLRSDNTSGYKGVSFHKQSGKWTARIMHNRVHINIGSYETPDLAYAAYCEKANELHGEFACLGVRA